MIDSKPSSVRPIVNMSSKPTTNIKGLNLSLKSKLRTLCEVIKFENKRNGNGAHLTVFGVDDIHSKLEWFTARKGRENVHIDIQKFVISRFVVFKGCKDQVKKTFEKDVDLEDDCRKFHQFTKGIPAAIFVFSIKHYYYCYYLEYNQDLVRVFFFCEGRVASSTVSGM